MPNWIECGLNSIKSGMEWNVGGDSLSHMQKFDLVLGCLSVRKTQKLKFCSGFEACYIYSQLDGILLL